MSFGIGLGILLLVVLALGRTVHDKEWYEAQEGELVAAVEHTVDEQAVIPAEVVNDIAEEKSVRERVEEVMRKVEEAQKEAEEKKDNEAKDDKGEE